MAHVEKLDGKWIPQRGVRIYRASSGDLFGVVIKNGYEQFEFGGGSEFTRDISEALAALPRDVQDWDAHIHAAVAKIKNETGNGLGVVDGWYSEVRVNDGAVQFDSVVLNIGPHVDFIGDRDPKIKKLRRLLDLIALELGREQMALH